MLKRKIRLFIFKLLSLFKLNKSNVFYVGSKVVLPAPLEKNEERRLLERLEEGDKTARALLIEHNLRLVVYIAKRFENSGVHIEDLISIGSIGLIKAVNTFKHDKQIKLATYASRCIENEILMYLRKTSRMKGEISFDEPLNTDWDGNELKLSDILGTESDLITSSVESKWDIQMLKKALSHLTDRERLIMEMRFGLTNKGEQTQKDVADKLGISQSYISRLEKKIIKRLHIEFQKING
ncbi:MAG TPA: RNA polymerase sporulation sigma factor SigE [Pseudogracilibacillus sp.]|nr:RNA polymerase sporulation sigma factor SigE [Pseudogracilibacillus sp.]